jgi:hypothetical protein
MLARSRRIGALAEMGFEIDRRRSRAHARVGLEAVARHLAFW